ncbi:M24 family metallopeptidase [Nitrospinota bacterium]
MSLSTQERDRRYGQLRADMQREGLDVHIVYGSSGRSGNRTGHIAYVSNFRPFSAGQQVLVFPLEGEPVLFVGVENQRIEALRTSWLTDVRCNPRTPVLSELCGYLKETLGAGKRIGIASLHLMPAAWYQKLQEEVPAKEWVEAGELILERRLVKSDEEIALLRRAAELSDKMWDHLRENVREGMTELEIRTEMDRAIMPGGGTENFNMMGLASMADGGEAPWGYVIPPTDRKIKRGDAVLFEISPRVEGYWNQIVRVLCLGPAAKWLTDAYDVVRLARDESLKHLRPGEPMVAMITATKRVIEEHGYDMWPYGLAHLTGLDLGIYPFTEDTTGTLMPGMGVVVHPMFPLGPDRQLFMGETYVVTEDGYEPLNRCSDELACL